MKSSSKAWIINGSLLVWTVLTSLHLLQTTSFIVYGWGIIWLSITFYSIAVFSGENDDMPDVPGTVPSKTDAFLSSSVVFVTLLVIIFLIANSRDERWGIIPFIVLPLFVFLLIYATIKIFDYISYEPIDAIEYVYDRRIPERIEQKRARQDLDAITMTRSRLGRRP